VIEQVAKQYQSLGPGEFKPFKQRGGALGVTVQVGCDHQLHDYLSFLLVELSIFFE
jgi:hypothetical protein